MADYSALNPKSTLPSDALVAMVAYVTGIPSGTLHVIMESYRNARMLEDQSTEDILKYIRKEET